ncbi:MAG: polysaccharide deacetylase family protein [Burkholderiaceae bacterium]
MKKLTLTFDNGPSAEVTRRVLDVLDKHKLTAWFCVVGQQLMQPGATALVKQAKAAGHKIVNHSMNHKTPLGEDLSAAHAQTEVRNMHDLMNTELGDWGELWFRPFGRGGALGPHVFSQAAVNELTAMQYSVLMWNNVPRDWVDPDGWVETALEKIARTEHTVIVLHDLPTGAMDHLPRFIEELNSRSIEITSEVPADCVPMSAGNKTAALDLLTA